MTYTITRGIVHIDGQPRLLVSADYPYYRDDAANWEARLRTLHDLGITVVTCYFPWRHHQLAPDQPPDFSGATQPNRDVHRFLALCQQLGMDVIGKPGPFIHAETNYGGLPDWVCPLADQQIEPLCDAAGRPAMWPGAKLGPLGRLEDWPLPAPFDPRFLAQTVAWLRVVGSALIAPHSAPHGPIVLVQIANEGVYSNGQHAPWAYDYSESALALYRDTLAARYTTIAHYNAQAGTAHSHWRQIQPPAVWHTPTQPRDMQPYLDWGQFQATYMAEVYRAWGDAVGTQLPLLVNLNPPLRESYGNDAWLTRVVPEQWPNVHYGYTNWIGVVAADASAYDRYLLLTKRAPGINLEENWGFSILYEPAYIDAAASFYQTLLALCGGATGFNIYTGVATAAWDATIDAAHARPYPDCPPITADGTLTAKAETVRWLAGFLDRYGPEFLACQPPTAVAWGLYLPYAQVAAWSPDLPDSAAPICGQALSHFQAEMRLLGVDYALCNLQTATVDELLRFPRLVLHGGSFMEQAVQAKLLAYVAGGGRLAMLGALPQLDEHFAPCALLAACTELQQIAPTGYAAWLAANVPVRLHAGQADVWLRSHPQRDLHFVTVLLPTTAVPSVTLDMQLGEQQHHLRVDAAPGGGALLRIEHGVLTAAIVKGLNGFLHHAVTPVCDLDGIGVRLDQPGDLCLLAGEITALQPSGAVQVTQAVV